MSAPRGIPTSRAYWELQAEKLMNRIFEPVETIDLEPQRPPEPAGPAEVVAAPAMQPAAPVPQQASARSAAEPAPEPTRQPAAATPRWQRARRPKAPDAAAPAPADAASEAVAFEPEALAEPAGFTGRLSRQILTEQPLMLLAVFAAAGLVTATSGVLALSQWNRFQDSLQQERNMLLVERLRNFGPAASAPAATPPAPTLAPPAVANGGLGAGLSPQAAVGGQGGGLSDDQSLPPPPPQEPWIEQLGELPRPQSAAAPLRVPISPRLAAATREAAPAPRRAAPTGPLPLLVGVVGSPGRAGSAIFQMAGSTSTVTVGDPIGNSGWRLRSTDGEGVLIENGGDVRRITIGSGG